MMMPEFLEQFYAGSGVWGDPILIVSGALFLVGWVMMFLVRMVKRFVYFTLLALLLPNSIGVVGYIQEGASMGEAVVERSEEVTEELQGSLEDMSFSPIYLSLISSLLAASVGIAGAIRLMRRRSSAGT
jgi:hypothetical protein